MAHSTTASARGGARLYNRNFRDVKATSTTNFRFLRLKPPFHHNECAYLARLPEAVIRTLSQARCRYRYYDTTARSLSLKGQHSRVRNSGQRHDHEAPGYMTPNSLNDELWANTGAITDRSTNDLRDLLAVPGRTVL
jgi:hypothetical protein